MLLTVYVPGVIKSKLNASLLRNHKVNRHRFYGFCTLMNAVKADLQTHQRRSRASPVRTLIVFLPIFQIGPKTLI